MNKFEQLYEALIAKPTSGATPEDKAILSRIIRENKFSLTTPYNKSIIAPQNLLPVGRRRPMDWLS